MSGPHERMGKARPARKSNVGRGVVKGMTKNHHQNRHPSQPVQTIPMLPGAGKDEFATEPCCKRIFHFDLPISFKVCHVNQPKVSALCQRRRGAQRVKNHHQSRQERSLLAVNKRALARMASDSSCWKNFWQWRVPILRASACCASKFCRDTDCWWTRKRTSFSGSAMNSPISSIRPQSEKSSA